MRVLVVGSGGREHAVIRKLKENPEINEIICAPGNGGIAAFARCEAVGATDLDGMIALALKEQVDFCVVTPDDPLALGMVDAMELGLNFRSPTASAVTLMEPRKHNIDLRVAEQEWDTVQTGRGIVADKYVLVIVPKNYQPGNIAPASQSDASGTYSVYYYAGYRDGKQLWEIDPFNYICKINGVDYMADVRRALGK